MESKIFSLPTKATQRGIVEAIGSKWGLEADTVTSVSGCFLDTFDGRLRTAGLSLIESGDLREGIVWMLHSAERTERLELEPFDAPRRREELAGRDRISKAVAGTIGIRALLPQVAVQVNARSHRVIDERRKTVARLRFESALAWEPNAAKPKRRRLVPVAVVAPLKGYDRQAFEIAETIRGVEGVSVEERTLPQRAMERCGIDPPERKRPVELEPGMTARQATVTILRHELDQIERNEEGARQDLDSEFLHDFRVAVRRTRSAIGQTRGVLDPRRLQRFKNEFRWLGKNTGPTRDLDVYLLKMPGYRKQLPADCRADLEPLEKYLTELQREAHAAMASELASPRYRRLVQDWRKFLQVSESARSKLSTPSADRPAVDLATARIRKRFRRVLRDGNAIEADTPNEALHRLRIECKKLRYILEFFSSLFDPESVRGFVSSLKQLQDTLGDFQDLEVQQQALAQFGGDLAGQQSGAEATLLAMGRLIERLRKAQQRKRAEFHRRFAQFASRENRRRFLRLFPKAGSA